jgi:L-aspartate oxidase
MAAAALAPGKRRRRHEAAALARRESRGGHWRADHPGQQAPRSTDITLTQAAALAPGKRRRRHEEPGDGLRGAGPGQGGEPGDITLTQAFATADALATADAVARPSSLVEATR